MLVADADDVRASLITRTFLTRDPVVLTQAFITYVWPLLEYCRPTSVCRSFGMLRSETDWNIAILISAC